MYDCISQGVTASALPASAQQSEPMKLVHSKDRTTTGADAAIAAMLADVSIDNLRSLVEKLAFPRHYFAQNRANPQGARPDPGRGVRLRLPAETPGRV
jgi:hypothetical protein